MILQCNNIFLWHESEDFIFKIKKHVSKISVDSNFNNQVMHNCVFHCSHFLLKLLWFSVKIALISYWNDFSLIPLKFEEVFFFEGELRIFFFKFKFWQFWEHLYLISVSMPLGTSHDSIFKILLSSSLTDYFWVWLPTRYLIYTKGVLQ